MCLMLERARLLEPNVGYFLFQLLGWFLANPWFVVDVFQRVLKCHHLAGQFRNCVCLSSCAKSIGRVIIKCGYFLACFLATAGNTLGSLTTYWIGRWFPKIDSKNDRTLWAINKIQRYGAITLLLSWLPIIGDLFCAVAGWLRLNWLSCLIFMTIGKGLRYIALLFFSLPFVS